MRCALCMLGAWLGAAVRLAAARFVRSLFELSPVIDRAALRNWSPGAQTRRPPAGHAPGGKLAPCGRRLPRLLLPPFAAPASLPGTSRHPPAAAGPARTGGQSDRLSCGKLGARRHRPAIPHHHIAEVHRPGFGTNATAGGLLLRGLSCPTHASQYQHLGPNLPIECRQGRQGQGRGGRQHHHLPAECFGCWVRHAPTATPARAGRRRITHQGPRGSSLTTVWVQRNACPLPGRRVVK